MNDPWHQIGVTIIAVAQIITYIVWVLIAWFILSLLGELIKWGTSPLIAWYKERQEEKSPYRVVYGVGNKKVIIKKSEWD